MKIAIGQCWLPGNAPAATLGTSPARSSEDLPLPDGPPITSVRAVCSRATQFVDERFSAEEERGVLGLVRRQAFVRARRAGCRGAEAHPDGSGGLVERPECGRFPLGHRGESLLWLRCKAAKEHLAPRRRNCCELCIERIARRRDIAGEEVPQHCSRRENVGRRADLRISTPLLGRPVVRRAAHDRRSHGCSILILGEPEVADDNSLPHGQKTASLRGCRTGLGCLGIADDQQIRRLHVAVHDVRGMERAKPVRERDDHGPYSIGVCDSARFDAVREHTAAGELHHEEGASVVERSDVVHRDDVGVVHASQELCLANKSLAGFGVVRVLRAQHLDGNVSVERVVERGQDDAEPADAQDRTNPISADLFGDALHRTPFRASEEFGYLEAVDE